MISCQDVGFVDVCCFETEGVAKMMMNCPTLADFIGGCYVDFLYSFVGIVDSVVPFVMVF